MTTRHEAESLKNNFEIKTSPESSAGTLCLQEAYRKKGSKPRSTEMIGKILSQLLGNAGEEASEHAYEELMDLEEDGWVIVNLPDAGLLSAPEADPLEDLLIEHPSMSVYQMRCRVSGVEEEEDEEDEEGEDNSSRPVAVRRHISWHLAAWGIPLSCNIQLLATQRARAQAERKTLSRSFLQRQNLTRLRFPPPEKRFGHFKQPSQRLYNY